MGKRIKLYKCNALTFNENESKLLGSTIFNTVSNVVTEYVFAGSKTEATNIFESRYKNNIHLTISEVKMSPGLIIYKNLYNSTIEDNELSLSVDLGDKR